MQLLHSEMGMLVKSGFVYVPLLFDPDIARELQERSERGGGPQGRSHDNAVPVVELDGKLYIKSVNLQSVLANYEKIDKEGYDRVEKDLFRKYSDFPNPPSISPTGKLRSIIFGIMPYFIRKGRGFTRTKLNDEELLDLIGSQIDIPASIVEQADQAFDSGPIWRRLNELEQPEVVGEFLEDGPITAEALRQWMFKALGVPIVNRERVRLEQELCEREQFRKSKRDHVATLLYLAEEGSFELDGFGFSRIGSRDDYLIYKRTGEYILQDYYAQKYLFPDCRVAVSTNGPLRPLVVESYKHPFLVGYAPRQEICVRGYSWPDEFTTENIIKVLEEGINALLYGYDPRRRNGYHSLDPTMYYVKTVEFVDYRI